MSDPAPDPSRRGPGRPRKDLAGPQPKTGGDGRGPGRPTNIEKARVTIDKTVRLAILTMLPIDTVDAAIIAAYREELVARTVETIEPYPGLVSFFAGSDRVVAPIGLLSVAVPMVLAIAANHGAVDPSGLVASVLKPEVVDALKVKAERVKSAAAHPSGGGGPTLSVVRTEPAGDEETV